MSRPDREGGQDREHGSPAASSPEAGGPIDETAAGAEAAGHGTTRTYELFMRGTAFLEAGHPGPAATLLSQAARLAPTKSSIREALARAYYALGEFRRAAAEFERIADAAPSNDYAHFGLGCSLLALGRTVEARGRLRLATAMSPHRSDYADRLAEAERQAAV